MRRTGWFFARSELREQLLAFTQKETEQRKVRL
jgi:hypothetical protein